MPESSLPTSSDVLPDPLSSDSTIRERPLSSEGVYANDVPIGPEGNSALSTLIESIQTRQAKIGVLGLGYVGLPLATAFAAAGFSTIGFDTREVIVQDLMRGESHIGDIASRTVRELRERGTLEATNDMSRLGECNALLICVPTPLNESREPDMSFIHAARDAIRHTLCSGQLIVLESTTYPGTTDEVLRPHLEASGLKVGHDFFLAFSPERIDPGNIAFPLPKVPKVVGGTSSACLQAALALYQTIIERPVPVSSTRTAELTKLLENIFRSVNIALVNELAILCDRMGIDVWEVIDAASTKPYGFTRFVPGPGLGGHCIPIDPFYLAWKARQYDFATNFIELAGEVNRSMPRFVVERVVRLLNDEAKAVRGARIAVLGMSYKPDVGDARESPSIIVTELLLKMGAHIFYNDPYVPQVKLDGKELVSQPVEEIMDADCVLLLTHHSEYAYQSIADKARLILDTRNAFKNVKGSKAHIVKL